MISKILSEGIRRGASDVHISADRSVYFRLNGELEKILDLPLITTQTLENFFHEVNIFSEALNALSTYDTTYELDDFRFRVHIYNSFYGKSIAFRIIPKVIPDFHSLYLPDSVKQFTELKSGLVLVTGPTGSGKTTTLASLIQLINNTYRKNIVTIEDPIEYIYPKGKCLITQRQIGQSVVSFSEATREAVRQDPDIILLGELRDLETIKNAVTLAETGHLVFATLHTKSAAESFDRVIDVFPGEQQKQIRFQLSSVIQGVLAQRLIPSLHNGRVPMCELMVVNDAIRSLIREHSNSNSILDQIQMSHNKNGSQTFEQSLAWLLKKGLVDWNIAKLHTNDPDNLKRLLL